MAIPDRPTPATLRLTPARHDLSATQRNVIVRAGRDRQRRVWAVPARTAEAIARKGYATLTWRLVGDRYAADLTLTDRGRLALAALTKKGS